MFVLAAVVGSQLMLQVDSLLNDQVVPELIATTVEGGRSILSAIATGLISSVTLLLSLMLVAVQLAGSQFSPRTIRDWIGDRTQQVTIGIVLGTAVYCLLILRQTRALGEGEELVPHLSVLLALVGGVVSLVAVVRSVDHLTDSLRVGRVSGNIVVQTVKAIERADKVRSGQRPTLSPAPLTGYASVLGSIPDGAVAVESSRAGWIQQIDDEAVLTALEAGATARAAVALGSFTLPRAPLLWVWPAPDDACVERLRAAIAIGDTRTMQQDVGFGILQLVDIALRALSPGVNDPNTANDMVVHLGVILLALWERPISSSERTSEGRTVIRVEPSHDDYLRAAFDQLRRHGAGDVDVAATMVRSLQALRSEVVRRQLPGPVEPIDNVARELMEAVTASDLTTADKARVVALNRAPQTSPLQAAGTS